VAGHDHSLQLVDGGDVARLLVVSGAGSSPQITGVTTIEGSLFAHAHAGFVVLDFFATDDPGDALLVRIVETRQPRPVYTLGVDLLPPESKGQADSAESTSGPAPPAKAAPAR
jgi:hypothetical protein